MSPDHPAIRVSHLGKKYIIGGPQEKYLTFRDAIVSSPEKYQQYTRRSCTNTTSRKGWERKNINIRIIQKNART